MKVQLFTVILKSGKNGHQSSTWDPFCSIEIGCIKFVRKKASLRVLFSVL